MFKNKSKKQRIVYTVILAVIVFLYHYFNPLAQNAISFTVGKSTLSKISDQYTLENVNKLKTKLSTPPRCQKNNCYLAQGRFSVHTLIDIDKVSGILFVFDKDNILQEAVLNTNGNRFTELSQQIQKRYPSNKNITITPNNEKEFFLGNKEISLYNIQNVTMVDVSKIPVINFTIGESSLSKFVKKYPLTHVDEQSAEMMDLPFCKHNTCFVSIGPLTVHGPVDVTDVDHIVFIFNKENILDYAIITTSNDQFSKLLHQIQKRHPSNIHKTSANDEWFGLKTSSILLKNINNSTRIAIASNKSIDFTIGKSSLSQLLKEYSLTNVNKLNSNMKNDPICKANHCYFTSGLLTVHSLINIYRVNFITFVFNKQNILQEVDIDIKGNKFNEILQHFQKQYPSMTYKKNPANIGETFVLQNKSIFVKNRDGFTGVDILNITKR